MAEEKKENPTEGTDKPTEGTDKPTSGDDSPTKAAIDYGMFNFKGIMDTFYNYEPAKNDSEGRAIKNNFMANMIQSGFDSQMAKDMSQQQSQIAQSNMTLAADLEQRNTASNMEQEFNYGMQSMGAQFDYQDKFADNQLDRDKSMLGATGDEQRKTMQFQDQLDAGKENRQSARSKSLARAF